MNRSVPRDMQDVFATLPAYTQEDLVAAENVINQ